MAILIGGGTYFHTMQDVDELVTHRQDKKFIIIDDDEEDVVHVNGSGYESPPPSSSPLWEPSGSWWKDFLYFSGPGMSYEAMKRPYCLLLLLTYHTHLHNVFYLQAGL